jgi:D-3-phosphoglycerate dehydrogenase
MKILVTEPRIYNEEFLDVLNQHEIYVENILEKSILDMDGNVDVLLIALDTKLNEKELSHFPNLKYIVTPSTGTDHIDENYCTKKGVKIISLKGETDFLKNITATAEHAFGLILSLTRNIPSAFDSVKNNEWAREKFVGNELNGKTLGILGFGRYGKIMAKYAKAFNMDVIAYDPSKNAKENMKKYDVTFQPWDKVFQKSDVVSIHINLNEKTHGIIGKKEFELMKNDAVLINTSRGQIVVEEYLLSALEKNKIFGAAVDVLSTENQKSHPIVNPLVRYSKKHNNLIITPHIGGSTHESIDKTVRFVLKKLTTTLN